MSPHWPETSEQRELPGIRVTDVPEFDLTPEISGPIVLGDVLDATRVKCMRFSVPLDSIDRPSSSPALRDQESHRQ